MALHWSNPIPQALQQHGSPPKRAADTEPPVPLETTLEMLARLDRAGPFATSSAFEPKLTKT